MRNSALLFFCCMLFASDTGSSQSPDDGGIWVQNPKIVVNGTPLAINTPRRRVVSGDVVWFYVPGRGRFILATRRSVDTVPQEKSPTHGPSLFLWLNKFSFIYDSDCFELVGPVRIPAGTLVYFDRLFKYPSAVGRTAKPLFQTAGRAEKFIWRTLVLVHDTDSATAPAMSRATIGPCGELALP